MIFLPRSHRRADRVPVLSAIGVDDILRWVEHACDRADLAKDARIGDVHDARRPNDIPVGINGSDAGEFSRVLQGEGGFETIAGDDGENFVRGEEVAALVASELDDSVRMETTKSKDLERWILEREGSREREKEKEDLQKPTT